MYPHNGTRAFDRIKDALRAEGCEPKGNANGNWHCPAHDDRTPSLSITSKDGQVLLHCHAGCEIESVLGKIGFRKSDLFDKSLTQSAATERPPVSKEVARYDYTDKHGEFLSAKIRWEPGRDGSGAKSFTWTDGNPKVLYEAAGISESEHVFINEGEKAADRLNRDLPAGSVATCSPTSKWEPEFTESLIGKYITLWVDRDEPGRRRAATVYGALTAEGIDVSLVQSAETSPKADAYDHLDAGFRIDEALGLVPSQLIGGDELYDAELTPQAERFPTIDFYEVEYRLHSRGLIKGVIDRGALVVTYGASNSSKTFLALDMALCVGSGRAWHGRKVLQQLSVYVASEGGGSITNRIRAYRECYLKGDSDVRFAAIPVPVNLLDEGRDVSALVERLRKLEDRAGMPCGLVTIDTLSQSMPGGDENGPKDMTAAVHAVNWIRRELGCAVNLVHHTGKNEAAGARGHSSLRAATDTELEVSDRGDGFFQVKPTKQRDYSMGEPISYQLEVVEIGEDEDGDMQTTCVVVLVDRDEVPMQNRRGKLGARGKILVRCMEELLAEGRGIDPPSELESSERHLIQTGQFVLREEDVRKSFYPRLGVDPDMLDSKPDSLRKAFNRTRDAAQASEYIAVYEKYLWFKQ